MFYVLLTLYICAILEVWESFLCFSGDVAQHVFPDRGKENLILHHNIVVAMLMTTLYSTKASYRRFHDVYYLFLSQLEFW
jgi:hypothetical protein